MGYEQVFDIRALPPPKILLSKEIAGKKEKYKYRKTVKDSQFSIKVESTWCNPPLDKARTRQESDEIRFEKVLHFAIQVKKHKHFHTFLITLSIIIVASWISTRN